MNPFQYKPRAAANWEKREKQSGGSFIGFLQDSIDTYTVKKGENWVRILPPTWENAEHYGMDVWVHYGVGPQNAALLCLLKNWNQACPVCEAKEQAENDGKEELAQELRASKRVLVFVLDRKDEKKVLAWAMPWTLDRDISKVARDRQTGELYAIDDPFGGYDVSFDTEGDSTTRKYVGVQIARKPTSVAEGWLQFITEHPLPSILIKRTYAETKLFLSAAPPAVEGQSQAATSGATMPAGLSPKQEAEWEAAHGVQQQAPLPRAVPQESQPSSTVVARATVAEMPNPSPVVQSVTSSTESAPVTSRSDVGPTSGTAAASAPVAASAPAGQAAAPAGTMSRAEMLKARFAK